MNTSLHWLNKYLSTPTDAAEAERLLTDQGFPIEGTEAVGDGDTMLDVEVTSNRGDCLSHLGVAREVAAGSSRTVVEPDATLPDETGPDVNTLLTVTNDATDVCPHYTARVITGVKVGPSPKWLVAALQAVGLRSVNNVVDVTNFVLLELGQPLHAFDRDKLQGHVVVVRQAVSGETFTAIDGSTHKLKPGMLVIADSHTPQAIAGVMGGSVSEVTDTTTDIVLESAIFTPMSTRQTSRTLKLMSDSSYRFERGVDVNGVERASARAAKLIIELAGGKLAQGVIIAGDKPATPAPVSLRVKRCNDILGLNLSPDSMAEILTSLGMSPVLDDKTQTIACTIPSYRLDLYREIDLIEEVARLAGLDSIPVNDRIHIQARAPQQHIVARRKLDHILTAHGYFETVNFSFLTPDQAKAFVPQGHEAVNIDDDRRKTEPTLRPSLLPSLLNCRKANQDAGNTNIRLFEVASAWTIAKAKDQSQTIEKRRLAMLVDATNPQQNLRELRGVLDEIATVLTGHTTLPITPDPAQAGDKHPIYLAGARVLYDGQSIGSFGIASKKILDTFGLQTGVALAEIDIDALIAAYPPRSTVDQLTRFPGTERDLSLIVDEAQPWSAIESQIHHAQLLFMEKLEFLTTYRGKPIEAGRKSVSFRMYFRDPAATLRHEQVQPQMNALMERLKQNLNAEVRT